MPSALQDNLWTYSKIKLDNISCINVIYYKSHMEKNYQQNDLH